MKKVVALIFIMGILGLVLVSATYDTKSYNGFETSIGIWKSTGLAVTLTQDTTYPQVGSYNIKAVMPKNGNPVIYKDYASNVNVSLGSNISLNVLIKSDSLVVGVGLYTNDTQDGRYAGIKWCPVGSCGVNGGRLDVYTYANNSETAVNYAGNASCPAGNANNVYNLTVRIRYKDASTRRIEFDLRNVTTGAMICSYGRDDTTVHTARTNWTAGIQSDAGGGGWTTWFDEMFIREELPPAPVVSGDFSYCNSRANGVSIVRIDGVSYSCINGQSS